MRDVVIYTKSWCGYCTRAKELLSRKRAPFTEIEISDDTDLRDEMIERAGGRTTVPQIFIGETHVGGCDAPPSPIPRTETWPGLGDRATHAQKP